MEIDKITMKYVKAINAFDEYEKYCLELKNELNKKFKTDIVEDIILQKGDGLVIVWNENNSYIATNILKEIKTLQEFKEYLDNTRI